MKTERLTQRDLDRAAAILRAGGKMGIHTATVYGLSGSGLDETALARIC